mgnify:CR=1 FL=1
MLSGLLVSLRCVLPIVALILLGFVLRRINFLTEEGIAQLNKLSYRILLPVMLFRSVCTADFSASADWRLIGIAIGTCLFSFVAAVVLSYLKCGKRGPVRASLAQGILRNNCVVFGMSLISSLYGEGQTGLFSMLMAFVIPINNVLAVVLLSLFTSRNVKPLAVLRGIVTNPFVLAVAAGFAVQLTGLRLPSTVDSIAGSLSGAAAPIALLGVGAGLRFTNVDRQTWSNIAFGVFARLVLLALICTPVYILLGIRGMPLVALYMLVATPSSESCYVMAREMGADAELAGQLVVFQVVFLPLTLLIGLTILSAGGWM